MAPRELRQKQYHITYNIHKQFFSFKKKRKIPIEMFQVNEEIYTYLIYERSKFIYILIQPCVYDDGSRSFWNVKCSKNCINGHCKRWNTNGSYGSALLGLILNFGLAADPKNSLSRIFRAQTQTHIHACRLFNLTIGH